MTLRVWDLEDMDPEELAKISTPIEAHIASVRRAWGSRPCSRRRGRRTERGGVYPIDTRAPSMDNLETRVVRDLMPTPMGSDGEKGGPNQRGAKGDLRMSSVVHRLTGASTAPPCDGGAESSDGQLPLHW